MAGILIPHLCFYKWVQHRFRVTAYIWRPFPFTVQSANLWVQFSYRNVVANEAETWAHLNTSLLVLCQTGRDFTAQSARTVGQKTNVIDRNMKVCSEEEWGFWAKIKSQRVWVFPGVKSFWKWLYWEMYSTAFPCVSASCLLGWVFPLETNCAEIWATWEKLRTRKYEAWTHKKIVTEVGFHERIYFHVKPWILILAGHVSPWNFGPVLSYCQVRLTNHIDFTFTV